MAVQINQQAIHDMAVNPDGPIYKLIEQKAYAVEDMAKLLMKIPGSGRVYEAGEYFLRRGPKVYHWTRTKRHQASAPGEPAASDSGYMATTIHHKMEHRGDSVVGIVEIGAKYGIYTELGTRYMAPRPVLRPALHAVVK